MTDSRRRAFKTESPSEISKTIANMMKKRAKIGVQEGRFQDLSMAGDNKENHEFEQQDLEFDFFWG